jgi:prevent-host-death family protein
MSEVAVRDLRNHTADILEKVRNGETVTITVRGRPVARLGPVPFERPSAIPRAELLALLRNHSADPGLHADLARLAGETTDDLGDL